ncbi:MAG TPA: PIN domain-containing protein [Candidatus Sulfomarinibacteraceae bacterium]|nr:PIN domain-containing protein [Candidatus Sulfomarinibacteraceae bacterium]
MIVLDSSFLVAYHNTRDAHHKAASEVMARFLGGEWGRGLLLEYVFLEVVTVLMARRGARVASEVADVLLAARELDLVPCSELFIEALETFRRQKKTRLSLVDATIVNVARDRADGLVATFDRELAGLREIKAIPD